VRRFRAELAGEIGEGRARLLTCDFTTTTSIERTASEIVLMDAFSPYFDYLLSCVCGIPALTLLGEPADLRAIRARVDVLAELDLGWWTSSLAPIADRLVDASEGRADTAFFRGIYKPQEAYGGDQIFGWIARLHPYVADGGRYTLRNPLLEHPLDWKPSPGGDSFHAGCIRTEDVPARAGSCLVRVNDRGERFDVVLEGGLMAIEVEEGGCLVPRAAWTLRRSEGSMDAVIESLRERADVVLEPPAPPPDPRRSPIGAAEHLALADACSRARLFVGAAEWTLRAPEACEHVKVVVPGRSFSGETLTRFMDLPDGTILAYAHNEKGLYVVRLRDSELRTPEVPDVDEVTGLPAIRLVLPQRESRERLTEIPVVGRSLAQVREDALRTGGDVNLPVLGTMEEALPEWMRRG
jgi:hypothetical protein